MEEHVIPDPPSFSDEDIRHCRETGDYKPILFEWYKFVASLGFVLVNIVPTCPEFRSIPAQHYHVLMGLLNRCTRLMLSNVALSHEGKFGENTAIVDRCVFESAIKIIGSVMLDHRRNSPDILLTDLKPSLSLRPTSKQISQKIKT
jgi:hypothetical protein